jgi:hypothetical protein
MGLSATNTVAVVQLVVYIPLLVLAIIVTSRHGWQKASGWIYTAILCLIRVIGSICQLVSIHDSSSGLIEATLILEFIGLSPLLFATLGLLWRLVYSINAGARGGTFGTKKFWAVHSLITLAAILCIAGGAGNTSGKPSDTIKAGILVYVAAFVIITLFFILVVRHWSIVPVVERRIFLAIAAAWPLLLVRLLYSVIAEFGHSHEFSIFGGNVGIRVGMATVEEILVVLDYVVLGLVLQRMVKGAQPQLPGPSRNWK